ncbi:MAG TPA: serine/threonine-protein kinase [Marmoricola sp.]|nr:serine/threonine-protein kinase [Marmoricola sp.]
MTSLHARPPDIGGYRLLRRIGEGGMGVVHLAEDRDGRQVALKVLRPHVVGDEEGRQRLAREVASLRKVQSPHVAEVLDADPWGETPYVVTRLVRGRSLHDLVREHGPFHPTGVHHVARLLLIAVRDVHSADVLHRDLKPTNVVMAGRDPVLIDFGLARLADDPRLTMTGWLLGTPGYLAPETLFGDPATPATDVHGWAATVAYAAQGEPPYGRGHTMAVLERTRRGEASLGGVPAPLLALLRACLAVEPLDRPTVAEAMAALDAPATAALRTSRAAAAAEPATRPYTVVAPVPPPPLRLAPTPLAVPPGPRAAPTPSYPAPAGRPDGGARLRRTAALLALLAGVAVATRAAPYLTLFTVALGVLVLRGVSRTQEASWRRRYTRGPRWSDGPRSVVGYPWHLLAGAAGTVVNVTFAAGLAATTTVGMLVLGSTGPEALTVGGAVGGWSTWWGPGSRRVRQPLGWATGVLTRGTVVGWCAVGMLALAVAALWLVTDGVSWAPASGPPWQELRDALRAAFPSGL